MGRFQVPEVTGTLVYLQPPYLTCKAGAREGTTFHPRIAISGLLRAVDTGYSISSCRVSSKRRICSRKREDAILVGSSSVFTPRLLFERCFELELKLSVYLSIR